MKVTQKFIRVLIESGAAEDLGKMSDNSLNALEKMGYEVLARSEGIYGVNGILIFNNQLGLYAHAVRDSIIFRFL